MNKFLNFQLLTGSILFFASLKLFAEPSARDLYQAGLYEDAARVYEKFPEQEGFLDKESLAKCYFASRKFQEVIQLLANEKTSEEGKYLLALAYQQLHQHMEALSLLELLSKDENISYSLAESYFYVKNYSCAKKLFLECLLKQEFRIKERSALFLIKIDVEQGDYEEAENKICAYRDAHASPEFLANLSYLQGDLFFRKKQYKKAVDCFEAILPKRNQKIASWYMETLYQLGWSYLKLAEQIPESSKSYFEKAEYAFSELSENAPQEKVFLSYAEALLLKGKSFGDAAAYEKANKLLNDVSWMMTQESRNTAFLMKARAALNYEDREKRYAAMAELLDNPLIADTWYERGMNEWEEAQATRSKTFNELANKHCRKAVSYFKRAVELYSEESLQKVLALKHLAAAYFSLSSEEDIVESVSYLSSCIDSQGFNLFEDPLEIYYLRAFAQCEIKAHTDLEKACSDLEKGLKSYSKGAFVDKSILLLAKMYFLNKEYEAAEKIFLSIPDQFPHSESAAQAYYGASLCAKAANKREDLIRAYKKRVFDLYPESAIAPECFFNFYSYAEYLQGDRKALKHLQMTRERYPKSPFILNASYLIGMDLKRDRKSIQGKWVSKKNLTQAIEAFLNVETDFEALYTASLIPPGKLAYYLTLRYRSILERALANFTIAEESKGAKRQIYLEYASEVYKKILDEFRLSHPFSKVIRKNELFSKFEEESYYYLVKIYWQLGRFEQAEQAFQEAMARYQKADVTKSYFLAKLTMERGFYAFEQKAFFDALIYFRNAREAGHGNILNSEDLLDLLIYQGRCLQALGELEEAMLLLAQVINCDVASSLRVKAMFVRAEIYEQQGKPQLAKRQLETIVAKGGDWAQKAQEKLEKDYGFY
ncbi:Uncharacterized protein PHSC3_000613 [Chlamydiales bacterium STE3]|nr:Uncharacterized protein PHSC3_000613 [Chlamydiales bacterium STE3]